MRSKLNGWNDSRFGPAFKGPPDSRAHLRDWLSKTSTILCLAIMAIFLMAWPACADSSGLKNPGTGASVTEGTCVQWTNYNNITSLDNSNATAALRNQYSAYLRGTNYGFNIPASATIDGIEVTVYRSSSASSRIRDNIVRLVKNGNTDLSDNKADTSVYWPTNRTAKTYGSSTDLWNTAWTPEDINKSNFGAQVRAYNSSSSSATARVDCIQITVYYTTDYITDSDWINASGYASSSGASDPGNAYASDNKRAIFAAVADQVDYTFGANIVPANAVIRGVEVRMEAQRTTEYNANRTLDATLYDRGTVRGSAKNTGQLTTSDAFYILGGPSDVWGYDGWTAAKINSNLRVRVKPPEAAYGQAQLDCISIRVTYAIPDTIPPVIAPPRSTPSTSTPRPSWTMTVRNWASRA